MAGCALALVVMVLGPRETARAQQPADTGEQGALQEQTREAPTQAVVRTRADRRAVPDYDGLPDPGPTPEQVLVWIPRILFAPLYFVSEVMIRRPLGTLLTHGEEQRWQDILVDWFTWEHRHAGLVPIAFYDFGFLPSVGLFFFWNDLGTRGHQLRARIGFGGVDFLRATLRDRVLAGPVELSFRADAWRRPDLLFQGIGARGGPRTRLRQAQISGAVHAWLWPWRRSFVALTIGIDWNDFDPDGYDASDDDPSLATALANGTYAPPAGLDGYIAYRQRLRFAIDSRERAPGPGHGLRVEGAVEQAMDLREPAARSWLRYGAGVAGFVELGPERILSLHARASFVDPMGSLEVPFTELVRLGDGVLDLPGFLGGQLRGRSAVAATLRYRWPVWIHIDASLFVGTGNVFDEHLAGFAPERLRLGWGLGIQSLGDRDAGFRILIAFGTRTFDRGADVESVDLSVGATLDL